MSCANIFIIIIDMRDDMRQLSYYDKYIDIYPFLLYNYTICTYTREGDMGDIIFLHSSRSFQIHTSIQVSSFVQLIMIIIFNNNVNSSHVTINS